MYKRYLKRILDIALALIALIFLMPLLLVVAVLIFLEDGYPIIYRQKRVGQYERVFTLYKFRSMSVNVLELPSAEAKLLPITRVGKIIRRLSIDELPQLINVIKGDMSLVGPRPILLSQHTFREARKSCGIVNFVPGISGLPQVVATDDTTEQEKVVLDKKYCDTLSFKNDFIIFLKTIAYFFRAPPAD